MVTALPLRVSAGLLVPGIPYPWPLVPCVGVHLVRFDSRDMVLWLCLWLCLSSLCNSSRVCMCITVSRNVRRICPLGSPLCLGRPSRSRAVARSGLPLWFGFVHYSPYRRGRACRPCYPQRVLFPPSFTLSGYPIMIRAVGYHRLHPRPMS